MFTSKQGLFGRDTDAKIEIQKWVDSMAAHLKPEKVHYCTGSQEEYDTLCQDLVQKGTFIKLDPVKKT